ncbi:tetraacyldisaccharide 4'-kinase [Mucilaginibacter sp. KACC 22773]|uniref:tetraacyldisaccharide 4'-kinase n=1 Tax=Mucilaginibacter sp. KACC 22773 TaxID=3025671 RepID=UPI002365874B|nr:tetraacyldisaccharide 4'-kinase [Mucilaginibacter sp. KACC 22773]WDF79874.1 tetraacyldisaccharide 4'-kinase [Mucilaginibacter sp. KACC 22773]
MKLLRWLLFPFSLIYGLVVTIRNWCYDAGVFKSTGFNRPVIVVGNLDAGGAGKSPMTEYLIRLFQDEKPTILSRGYGRKTKGFLLAGDNPQASVIGDEPAQFKHKFPKVTVAVCEKRVAGIQQLKDKYSLVILDDAYQHRALKPGFSILLFDYNRLNQPRLVLPTGNLREPFSGRERADVIVISKCPPTLADAEMAIIKKHIKPLPHQQLFFTSINYLALQNMNGATVYQNIDEQTAVFVLTGIANPAPLLSHLKNHTSIVNHHKYPDHHQFSLKNISKLADDFFACTSQKKLIITTEKDAQRLGEQELQPAIKKLPILVLPIGISFLNNGKQQFDNLVTKYVRQY